jgi:hypothetical protein
MMRIRRTPPTMSNNNSKVFLRVPCASGMAGSASKYGSLSKVDSFNKLLFIRKPVSFNNKLLLVRKLV